VPLFIFYFPFPEDYRTISKKTTKSITAVQGNAIMLIKVLLNSLLLFRISNHNQKNHQLFSLVHSPIEDFLFYTRSFSSLFESKPLYKKTFPSGDTQEVKLRCLWCFCEKVEGNISPQ
jgi:hypothetical protein